MAIVTSKNAKRLLMAFYWHCHEIDKQLCDGNSTNSPEYYDPHRKHTPGDITDNITFPPDVTNKKPLNIPKTNENWEIQIDD